MSAQPPTPALPDAKTGEAASSAGFTMTCTATATGNADPNPAVTCTSSFGTMFPLGETTVTCTATDKAGNTATGTFNITVNYQWNGAMHGT